MKGGENTQTVKAIITYKTKIKKTTSGEEYFIPKKNLTRHDCNLKPCNHWGYNSDLFSQILGRAHNNVILNRSVIWLNTLPAGIEIIKEGFLARININVII